MITSFPWVSWNTLHVLFEMHFKDHCDCSDSTFPRISCHAWAKMSLVKGKCRRFTIKKSSLYASTKQTVEVFSYMKKWLEYMLEGNSQFGSTVVSLIKKILISNLLLPDSRLKISNNAYICIRTSMFTKWQKFRAHLWPVKDIIWSLHRNSKKDFDGSLAMLFTKPWKPSCVRVFKHYTILNDIDAKF